jgi:hypothetical protein
MTIALEGSLFSHYWISKILAYKNLIYFTLKRYLKAKEELWKLKYFAMQNYNLQKILQKKPKSFKILNLYN